MTEIQVSEIPAEGLSLSYRQDPGELDLIAAGVSFQQPIAVDVFLAKATDAVSVTGRIKAPAQFECARCLSRFSVPLDIPVATQFLQASPSMQPGEHQMPVEEAESYYCRDGVVVLDELVRQEVLLAVPFNPQCRADCRGLCPQCGQDLNVRACACAPPADPRWEALRAQLKRQ